MQDLITRLRERARIRRQIPTRKSVQEGAPDRIADLLEEAANEIEYLRMGDAERADFEVMKPLIGYYKLVMGTYPNRYIYSTYKATPYNLKMAKRDIKDYNRFYSGLDAILIEPKSE